MTEVISKVSLHLSLAPHDFSCHWVALGLTAGAWGLVVESRPAHMWPRPKARTYTEPTHETSRNAPLEQFLSLRCPPSQVQVTLAAQNFHFFLLSLLRLQFQLGSSHSAGQQESTLQSERVGAIVWITSCPFFSWGWQSWIAQWLEIRASLIFTSFTIVFCETLGYKPKV